MRAHAKKANQSMWWSTHTTNIGGHSIVFDMWSTIGPLFCEESAPVVAAIIFRSRINRAQFGSRQYTANEIAQWEQQQAHFFSNKRQLKMLYVIWMLQMFYKNTRARERKKTEDMCSMRKNIDNKQMKCNSNRKKSHQQNGCVTQKSTDKMS